jgi:hypothetical protein
MTEILRLGDEVLFHGRDRGTVVALEVMSAAGPGARVRFRSTYSDCPDCDCNLPYVSLTSLGRPEGDA